MPDPAGDEYEYDITEILAVAAQWKVKIIANPIG